ncbi:hypothetical protein HK102_006982, partial [Quaeritorhiza haematococci]
EEWDLYIEALALAPEEPTEFLGLVNDIVNRLALERETVRRQEEPEFNHWTAYLDEDPDLSVLFGSPASGSNLKPKKVKKVRFGARVYIPPRGPDGWHRPQKARSQNATHPKHRRLEDAGGTGFFEKGVDKKNVGLTGPPRG